MEMNGAKDGLEPYQAIIKDANGKEYPLAITSLSPDAVAEAYKAIGATDLAKIAAQILSRSSKLKERREALAKIPTTSYSIGKDENSGEKLAGIISEKSNEQARVKNAKRVLDRPTRRA